MNLPIFLEPIALGQIYHYKVVDNLNFRIFLEIVALGQIYHSKSAKADYNYKGLIQIIAIIKLFEFKNILLKYLFGLWKYLNRNLRIYYKRSANHF